MKNLILAFIFILILSLTNVYSQNEAQEEYQEWKSNDICTDFDISKYFTPDILRNQMYFYFYLLSDYSDYKNENNTNGDISSSYNRNNNSFTGQISSNFSRYINTRKKISNYSINLSLIRDLYSNKINDINTNNNYSLIKDDFNGLSRFELGSNWQNKLYFSKLYFLIYNIAGNLSYGDSNVRSKNNEENSSQKRNIFNIAISPEIGAGFGRIENVEDAIHSVYIVNALSKRNILNRNLTNEEMFELSQKISKIKNKRFLDSRLHLMEEISTVDSFFIEKGVLNNSGASYFTNLYDMWEYGSLFSRRSGYEITFQVLPNYIYDYSKSTYELQNEFTRNQYQKSIISSLGFNYEKPFKFKWQHSFRSKINYAFMQIKATEKESDYNYSTKGNTFFASASYSLGYYPNTRTNIRATAGQQISRTTRNEDNYSSTYYNTYLNFGLSYYFSPHFQVYSTCIIDYYNFKGNYNNSTYINGGKSNQYKSVFNIQMIYLMF